MKVRFTGGNPRRLIARFEAFLAGMILTVSTAYAATICPMYWTELQLEADLQNRLEIASAIHRWHEERGIWPKDLADIAANPGYLDPECLTNPLTGRPYRLDSATHQLRL
jgi:hypothetical protein